MDFTGNIVELWILYTIGTCMVFARAFVRTRLVGFRGYHADDYLVWFAWAVYTEVTVIATVFILKAKGLHTSLLTHEQRETLPLSQYHEWQYGTQIFIVGFTSYAVVVWTLKFNMLIFYYRVVKGLWIEKFVMPILCLVGTTAIAVLVVTFGTCYPFSKMWQILPDPGTRCVPQNTVIFYTVLGLNLTTDAIIMMIPLPILRKTRISRLRKLGLYFLFCLGFFCMAAAILRVVLIFKLNQSGISAMWSLREDFVALFIGQAPMVYPIFKRRFWLTVQDEHSRRSNEASYEMGKFKESGDSTEPKKKKDPYSISRIMRGTLNGTFGGTVSDTIAGSTMVQGTKSESQEKIIKSESQPMASIEEQEQQKQPDSHTGIQVHQTYDVHSQEAKWTPRIPWDGNS